jgi:ubiquinone/menaquinone biosynthesis C-methylase UbiE
MKKYFDRIKKEIRYFKSKNWPVSSVGEFWDSVVHYDEANADTYAHNRRFKDSLPFLQFRKEDSILDFCCRTGDAITYLSSTTSLNGKRIVCADVSKRFLEVCAMNLKTLSSSIETILITEHQLPFADNMFDIGFCFETIEHFSRPSQIIKEMARVLKKGGQVIFTTPNILWEPIHWIAAVLNLHHSEGPHNFLRRKNIIDAIYNANLSILKETTTVLLPCGPKYLTGLFERLEKRIPESVMRLLALRRIIVCTKK